MDAFSRYNVLMRILYLHGWHSVPGGVKPTFQAKHGYTILNPWLPDEDFAEAVRIAQVEFDEEKLQAIVGSSRGGAVVMNMNSGDARLVLLCPAWKKQITAKTMKADTVILHSRADDVVPFAASEELVRNSGLPAWTLIEVGSDHRLADPESLETMLEACLDDNDDMEEDASDDNEEDILERDWTALCYTAALMWVGALENRDRSLVHGTVLCGTIAKRVNRAWCERSEMVVGLAKSVGARIVERELYYRLVQPEVSKVYRSDDALLLAIKNGHDGPWDESERLKE
jgi:hypothetical protein